VGKKLIVIGSGFAGLSAATFMAKAGWEVTVLEKHHTPGGRARQWKEAGFSFDMGPSWYWMPDIFERYFRNFGKEVADYYSLKRLDPSYRVYTGNDCMDVPADITALKNVFASIEKGADRQLELFLQEAAYKYRVSMEKLVWKPGRSLTEFLDRDVLSGIVRLDIFCSMRSHVGRYFKDERIRQLMEFPVLFLGAMPDKIPALYSLMNHADIRGGTWYPQKGMYQVVEAMYSLAKEMGVQFCFGNNVQSLPVNNAHITSVEAVQDHIPVTYEADAVIATADYHHIETSLLEKKYRSYTERYWNTRLMAPGCLLYYIGLDKKLSGIAHHTLFLDTDFETHGRQIYQSPQWPTDPLFYACASSVSDTSVAPEDCENLFLLVPVAAGLENDTEALREQYLAMILARMEKHLQQPVAQHIIYKKTFANSDFIHEYNAFKGNAYGLANTLQQTAFLKPSCRSRKVKNLFYAGQLTVPGPGVPPALISGEIAAGELVKVFGYG